MYKHSNMTMLQLGNLILMPYLDEMHLELFTQSFSRGRWWQSSYCLCWWQSYYCFDPRIFRYILLIFCNLHLCCNWDVIFEIYEISLVLMNTACTPYLVPYYFMILVGNAKWKKVFGLFGYFSRTNCKEPSKFSVIETKQTFRQ